MSSVSLIQLWFCPLTQLNNSDNLTNQLKFFLSEDELAKVARYRQQEMKTRALYVRSLLRVILSRYAPIPPEQWQFNYGPKGKPELIAEQRSQTGIEFNLSHSGDYLLIGVIISEEENVQLGVDIEHARTSTDIDPILNHYFSAQEVTALLELPKALQRQRFFDLWALKESYIKATGQGLAKSLKSFGFDLSEAKSGSLLIQTTDPELCLYPNDLNKQVKLYSGIAPNFIENSVNSLASQQTKQENWQTCLGRLDKDYRFAVTLGSNSRTMKLEATLTQPNELLFPTN